MDDTIVLEMKSLSTTTVDDCTGIVPVSLATELDKDSINDDCIIVELGTDDFVGMYVIEEDGMITL